MNWIISIIIFIIMEKIDRKKKIVGVTITPGSRPEQIIKESCSRTLLYRCTSAGTKMQSPARRQNVGWFSSLEVRENQKLIH